MNQHTKNLMRENLLEVEAILFDVGGTLIEPWPSVGHVYSVVAADYGWDHLDVERINRQFEDAWKTKGDFQYNQEGWEKLVVQSFDGMVSKKDCLEFFPELYRRFEDPDVWNVHGDVMPALDDLASRGFRLAIVSNWDTRLKPLLHKLRLERFFEFICVSCDIGFTKPSPVIFEHTIGKMGLPPDRMLHVGDHRSEDFEGAKNAGLQALLLDRHSNGENGKVSRLTEVSHLVKEAWL